MIQFNKPIFQKLLKRSWKSRMLQKMLMTKMKKKTNERGFKRKKMRSLPDPSKWNWTINT